MTNEPVLTVAGIVAIIGALLGVAVSFGVALSAEQQAAILKLAVVAAPIIVGLVARQKVTPTK
jgi:hypothetical protein